MERSSLPAAPSDLSAKYEDAIRRRLEALMRARNYSQTQLCKILHDRGLALDQGNLSYMLKGKKHIPLSLIVHICDIFQLSLAELVDENFGGARQVGGSPTAQVYSDDLLHLIPNLGSKFVVDPHDPHFFGYLQTYHVYLYPTNSEDDYIKTGVLRLQAKDSVCEAVLEIHTNKIRDGQPLVKVYRGRCIISTTMRAVFILMTRQETGELMVLNFRYFHLMLYPLDCRVACVLLNATGSEHHPPAMQRLFLSRTEIREEDLKLLIPHLNLNSGMLRISLDKLDALRESGEQYAAPINDLLLTNHPQDYLFLDENDILGTARRHLDKPEALRLLSLLRSLSECDPLHKVGRRVDEHTHKLLRSMGYYRDFEN